jgi:hypothetical protein
MPYQPYQSTWQSPYLQQNPYQPVVPSVTAPGQQPPYQQQGQYFQQAQQGQYVQQPKVDGPAEAMSRFLMRYPENMLVPGFTTPDPIFDVNGRSFYALSIEPDGRRNLETFDYFPHAQMQQVTINGVVFASQAEYDDFLAKVKAVIGEIDGLHGPVQAASAAVPEPVPSGPSTAAATSTAVAPASAPAGV